MQCQVNFHQQSKHKNSSISRGKSTKQWLEKDHKSLKTINCHHRLWSIAKKKEICQSKYKSRKMSTSKEGDYLDEDGAGLEAIEPI